jgi:hypothetical protein
MNNTEANISTTPLKYCLALTTALLLVVAGSSCAFSLPSPAVAPSTQIVPVSQVVTQLVTRVVTQEATRVVEVPITIAPSDTPLYTFTPSLVPTITSTPTVTPTPEPPIATIQKHTDCLYGPGSVYLYKYSVFAGSLMEVVGRNMDGSWLFIQEVHGWNPCWIQTSQVEINTSKLESVPVVSSLLPYSNQYNAPDAIARRNGSEVTISWKAVWMSLDDYRGYLIEAWVCQGGTQTFIPISYVPLLANNTGTLSVKVIDEPGCSIPSSARIYSAVKQGYSVWANIPWPGY